MGTVGSHTSSLQFHSSFQSDCCSHSGINKSFMCTQILWQPEKMLTTSWGQVCDKHCLPSEREARNSEISKLQWEINSSLCHNICSAACRAGASNGRHVAPPPDIIRYFLLFTTRPQDFDQMLRSTGSHNLLSWGIQVWGVWSFQRRDYLHKQTPNQYQIFLCIWAAKSLKTRTILVCKLFISSEETKEAFFKR